MNARHYWTFLSAVTLCLVGPGRAGAGLGSLLSSSNVIYTHDLNDDGVVAAFDRQSTDTSVPFGYGGFHLAEATINSGGVDSTAAAGLGYSQNPFLGTALIQPGTFVSQDDPGHASTDPSTVTMDYDLRWDVTPTKYGPPILSNFSVPFLAVVAAGGEASVDVEVNWGKQNGATFTALRSQFVDSQVFGAGTTLTTIQATPAAFSPSSVDAADDYRIHGHIKFGAENTTAPVHIFPSVATPTVIYNGEVMPGTGAVPDLAPHLPNFPTGKSNTPATTTGVGTAQGIQGGAFDFSSPGSSLDALVPISDSFTAIVWGRANQTIFGPGSSFLQAAGPNGFSLGPEGNSTTVQATVNNLTGQPTTIGPFAVPNIAQFNQYGLVVDGTSNRAALYVNGVEVGSNTLPAVHGAADVALRAGGLFSGVLDEIMLLPHVVDPIVMKALFDLGQNSPNSLRELDNLDPFFGASPEPSSAVLLGICLVGVATARRRRS